MTAKGRNMIDLTQHRFFAQCSAPHLQLVAQCAQLRNYQPQEMLGREGEPSQYFFAILEGHVAIETVHAAAKRMVLMTVHAGDIVGWSWLFPPYEWVFDARAITPVKAIAFDTKRLRELCEADAVLGFDLMKRLAQVMTSRLKATRLQLIDMYAKEADRAISHRS